MIAEEVLSGRAAPLPQILTASYWEKFSRFALDLKICYKGPEVAGCVSDRVRPMIGVSYMTNHRAAFLEMTTCCL